MANARGRGREKKRGVREGYREKDRVHDREGRRRVRGSCFRPGEQQCPQTNEHPASIVRLIGTAQPLPGSACCPGPPYVVVRGPRRTPAPGWGVPDQPDAGQHRLNIAASSNLRQRDSSLSFFFFFFPSSSSSSSSTTSASVFAVGPFASCVPFVLPLDRSPTSHAFVSACLALPSLSRSSSIGASIMFQLRFHRRVEQGVGAARVNDYSRATRQVPRLRDLGFVRLRGHRE